MRNIIFIVILTVLSSQGCQDRQVKSQSNTGSDSSTNLSYKAVSNQAVKTVDVANNVNSAKSENSSKKQAEKPFEQIIQIINPPKIQNNAGISAKDDAEAFSFWKKSLRWGDFCGNEAERISVTFNQYAENKFVAEVMCLAGAYNFSYLFYNYEMQDKSATAKLMNFEYFTLNEKSKIGRHFTYNLYGAGGFDKEKNRFSFRYYPVGGGRCGWQNDYLIKGGKPILTQVTAQWNCEPDENGQDRDWKKMNLTNLRRKSGQIIYDQFEE